MSVWFTFNIKMPRRNLRIKRTTHSIHILVLDLCLPNDCNDVLADGGLVHHFTVETTNRWIFMPVRSHDSHPAHRQQRTGRCVTTSEDELREFYFNFNSASLM